jgi:hypothetical protein
MPAGVDFICKNEKCKCYDKSITLISAWPIADIDDVISSMSQDEYRAEFEHHKQNGSNYACIQFPNKSDVKMVGWKIQSWCQKCPRIGEDEIMISDPEESFESALARYNIPENCPVCNSEIKTFNNVVDDGLDCPFCNEKMEMQCWSAKEASEEYANAKVNVKQKDGE